MKWRQITIRTLFPIVTATAIFFAGYRLGFHHGRDAPFDELTKLIQDTIGPSSDWPTDGTLDRVGGGCKLLVPEGYPNDAANPFSATTAPANANDPFSSASPTSLVLCAAIPLMYAAVPEPTTKGGDSYYLYTKALTISDAGVVAVPSRFKWSIETSWSGMDAQGNDLADTRVMMRLYDPDNNFTALTAQMDLETAEKLQRELADIIAKKRQDPDYQHRPLLYDSSLIPTGEIKGVDRNGELDIELHRKRHE